MAPCRAVNRLHLKPNLVPRQHLSQLEMDKRGAQSDRMDAVRQTNGRIRAELRGAFVSDP
jgi:hypothetical protein